MPGSGDRPKTNQQGFGHVTNDDIDLPPGPVPAGNHHRPRPNNASTTATVAMPKARAMAHLEQASWVAWNFEKFLVDKDGTMIARFKSGVEPEALEA